MTNLYYVAPPDEAFNDMKKAAQRIWGEYGEPYRSEKLERIKNVGNIGDNFMYLFAMFDQINQRKIARILEPKTIEEVRQRLIAGGNGVALTQYLLGD